LLRVGEVAEVDRRRMLSHAISRSVRSPRPAGPPQRHCRSVLPGERGRRMSRSCCVELPRVVVTPWNYLAWIRDIRDMQTAQHQVRKFSFN
jgi:hypothetical protein